MDNKELLDFLIEFKQGEVYKEIERIRKKRLDALFTSLASPIKDIEAVLAHARLGGIADGVSTNLIDELIEELKEKTKQKEE